jgi:MoxR-like ATPase
MQEKEVTASGQTFPLSPPFFVLATQNPIELEGTYPLPEAQLDRFMFNIPVHYPSENEEVQIVSQTTGATEASVQTVLRGEQILRIQRTIRRIPASEHVVSYAVRIARSTRPESSDLPFVKDYVSWGAGPRASQYMILGAKTRAILHGNLTPSASDVRAVAPSVLRHRVITNFTAEAEGIKVDQLVGRILEAVPEPKQA